MSTNRGQNKNDTWLTPPEWIKALGPFDFDPCCAPTMPWRTAEKMLFYNPELSCARWNRDTLYGNDLEGDGLAMDWGPYGLVWCNPPYSKPLPWVEKMAKHRNGFLLLPAKSPETKWGQLLLKTGDLFLYMEGREPFHYEDGKKSEGAWNPYVLTAYGPDAQSRLASAQYKNELRGVLMRRA